MREEYSMELLTKRLITKNRKKRAVYHSIQEIIEEYYSVALRSHLPLSAIKFVKELINSKDSSNYLLAAEVLVKYDITKYR